MFLARVTFGTDGGEPRRREQLGDVVQSFIASLEKNGQACGEFLYSWPRGRLVGYTHLARPNAWETGFHSKWGRIEEEMVTKAFRRAPRWEILDDKAPKRFRSWKRSTSLFVWTHAFDDSGAVCCGDTGKPLPTYLLPIKDEDREDIHFWAKTYAAHDRVWLASAALEMPAYRQMAEVDSDLSSRGRGFCRIIEKATRIPTYYYLPRYWGYVGEGDRPCPGCERSWRVAAAQDDELPFHEFQFRCGRCRLVSHRPVDFSDGRRARIGASRAAT